MSRSVTSLLDLSGDDLRALAAAVTAPTPAAPPLDRRVVAVLLFGPEDVPAAAWIAAAARLGAGIVRAADVAPADAEPFAVATTAAQWADLLVVSHPLVGFARAVAEMTGRPVVNAGEGGGECPAAGISLLAAVQAGTPPGASSRVRVAVCGDLAESRSARALLAAVAATDATVLLVPARGREPTEDDVQRLARRTGRNPIRFEAHAMSSLLDMVDTVLLGPESTAQLPLFREVGVPPDEQARRVRREVEDLDVLFVAPGGGAPDRLVREPFRGGTPRMGQGVEHAIPLRALEVLLEHAAGRPAEPAGDPEGATAGVYRSGLGLTCRGERCVASRHRDVAVPDFDVVSPSPPLLACRYCGARVEPRFAASKLERRFHRATSADAAKVLPANLVLFRSRGEALASGFEPARRASSAAQVADEAE